MCLDVFVGYPDSKQLPVGVDDLSTIDAAPVTAGDDAVAVMVIGKQNTPCGSILLQETPRFTAKAALTGVNHGEKKSLLFLDLFNGLHNGKSPFVNGKINYLYGHFQ